MLTTKIRLQFCTVRLLVSLSISLRLDLRAVASASAAAFIYSVLFQILTLGTLLVSFNACD